MLNAYDGIGGYPLRTARSMLQKEIQLQKANDAGLHNVTAAELEDAPVCADCGDPAVYKNGLCLDCWLNH